MTTQNEFDFNKPLPKTAAPGEVLARVKKLLRMKHGGTDAEVETALRMAQRLAEEYNINLAELDLSEQSPLTVIVEKRIPATRNGSDDETCASFIIRRFFNVDAVFCQKFDYDSMSIAGELAIVGTGVDVDVAEYVFGFLVQYFKFLWRKRPKRIRNRRMFVIGVCNGLYSKLKNDGFAPQPLGSLREALTVSRQNYLQKHFPNLTSTPVKCKVGASAAARLGWHIGRNINIRPGVSGSAAGGRPALNDSVPQLTNGE